MDLSWYLEQRELEALRNGNLWTASEVRQVVSSKVELSGIVVKVNLVAASL